MLLLYLKLPAFVSDVLLEFSYSFACFITLANIGPVKVVCVSLLSCPCAVCIFLKNFQVDSAFELFDNLACLSVLAASFDPLASLFFASEFFL